MFVWVAVEETLDFLIILDWLEIEWDYCDEEDKIRVFFSNTRFYNQIRTREGNTYQKKIGNKKWVSNQTF